MQLEGLNNDLITMGALCENAIACAVKALMLNDMELASKAIATEQEIDRKERSIESLCLKLLLEQQPVARDLRLISSALKMITDMERIGDQARDIAELVKHNDLSDSKNKVNIIEMSEAAIKMVTDSIDAFVKRDLELAKSVIKYDDVVDNYFISIKTDLIHYISQNPSRADKVMDIFMIAKYLERIGDHATNIAEWVEFSIMGTHEE
jgi:phosphate transport system protein